MEKVKQDAEIFSSGSEDMSSDDYDFNPDELEALSAKVPYLTFRLNYTKNLIDDSFNFQFSKLYFILCNRKSMIQNHPKHPVRKRVRIMEVAQMLIKRGRNIGSKKKRRKLEKQNEKEKRNLGSLRKNVPRKRK